jgi:hemerythrin superfamily protein
MRVDALELLRNDHVAARGLLRDLEAMARAGTTREHEMEMLSLIEREVKIHTALEELLVYPAFHGAARERADERLFRELVDAHHAVDALFPALKLLAGTRGPFLDRLSEVGQVLIEHIEEEEGQLFPRARELLGPAGIQALGDRITREKQRLYLSWRGRVSGPLHRAKSVVDKLTPAAVKRLTVARRSRPVLRDLDRRGAGRP